MSTLMKLSATNPIAKRVMDAFNADQPRDERGRWGAGGPGSTERAAPFGGRPGQFPGLERANTAPGSFKQQERPAGRPSESVVLSRVIPRANAVSSMTSINDPRTTSSAEQDRMEARQLASGERVAVTNSPNQAGRYHGNPAAEGSRAVKMEERVREAGREMQKGAGFKTDDGRNVPSVAAGKARLASLREKMAANKASDLKEASGRVIPSARSFFEKKEVGGNPFSGRRASQESAPTPPTEFRGNSWDRN
jgi:hypothetical protein